MKENRKEPPPRLRPAVIHCLVCFYSSSPKKKKKTLELLDPMISIDRLKSARQSVSSSHLFLFYPQKKTIHKVEEPITRVDVQ